MKTQSLRFRLPFLLLPLASVAAVDQDQLKAELAKMENDFCTMASAQGVPAAFAHFAAPDAAFFVEIRDRCRNARPAEAAPGLTGRLETETLERIQQYRGWICRVLARFNSRCHSERSEESRAMIAGERPEGFFAALLDPSLHSG